MDHPKTLVVAVGANIPSSVGPPEATLIAVRPMIEQLILEWIKASFGRKNSQTIASKNLRWRWSPLYLTTPLGGPKNQPDYVNAVLVVDKGSLFTITPCEDKAIDLLEKLLTLEMKFGRNREQSLIKWGPRTLDIDLLAWGDLQIRNKKLTLPHPRIFERSFVVVPLAAALSKTNNYPRRIPPQKDWDE